MRDLTHVVGGLAVASCFPQAIGAAAAGRPLYFILAAVAALVPDWLDVHIARPACSADAHIVPDPLDPEPRLIAEGLVAALERAHATGRPLRVKLHAVPLAAGEWRSYALSFDPSRDSVTVRYGSPVDALGVPLRGPGAAPRAAAVAACRLRLQGMAEVRVTSPDGVGLLLVPDAAGRVTPVPEPWRRSWTHSLACAAVAGALGVALWDALAGILVAAVMMIHAAADSVGYEGAAFLYPWRRHGMRGLCRVRRGRALPNLLVLWGAGALIFWNLQQAGRGAMPWRLEPMPYLLLVLALPLFVWALGGRAARFIGSRRIFVDRSTGAA